MTVAQQIARYLAEHPNAADTLEGVVHWWLARQRYEDSVQTVEAALARLVEEGLVIKQIAPGGQSVYSRAPRHSVERRRQ